MEKTYSLIVAIVNNGYTDLVMEGARQGGAKGGTVLTARGTGNIDLEKFYGIPIQKDKEMVLIIVDNEVKDECLKNIYKTAGLETKGQGIAFTLPVDNIVGLSSDTENESVNE